MGLIQNDFDQLQLKLRCVQASKLRQLIELLFEIAMSDQCQFSPKSIVWAQVQNYPAWPAKIVRRITQCEKTIYKLHFLGDASYCYLHAQSLKPFSFNELSQCVLQVENFKLFHAIQLAKLSLSQQLSKICYNSTQSSPMATEAPIYSTAFEESKSQSKEDLSLLQKLAQPQRTVATQSDHFPLIQTVITPQNVLTVLKCYQDLKEGSLRDNLNRKQIISFQNTLKQNLLIKYNFKKIEQLKQTNNDQLLTADSLKVKRIFRKRSNKNKKVKLGIKELFRKKIMKIILQKIENIQKSKEIATMIMNKLQKQHKSENSLSYKARATQLILKLHQNISFQGKTQIDKYFQNLIIQENQIKLSH